MSAPRGRIPADVYEAVTVTAETCLYADGIEETAMAYQNEGHEDLAYSVVNAFQALAEILISLAETEVGRASGWFLTLPTKGDES